MTYERYQNGGPVNGPGSSLSPREIQSDLTEIRGEISNTVDAIAEKLEPKELFGKLVSALSADGGLVKGVSRAFSRNPIPIAMITGGVGYLIYSEMRARKSNESAPATPEDGANAGAPGALSRLPEAADSVIESSGNIATRARETASAMGHKATRLAGKAASATRGLIERGDTMMHEQPLVVAGLGLAIGAAIAGSAPMTRPEQELMGRPAGEALDKLVSGARQIAEDATQDAQDAILFSDEGEPQNSGNDDRG